MKKHLLTIIVILCACALLGSCTPQPPMGETEAPMEVDTSPVTDTPADAETDPMTQSRPDGSYSTARYDVTDVEGCAYINFKDGNELTAEERENPACQIGYVSFLSAEEMYDAFRNDKLTDDQVVVIKNAFTQTERGIAVPNMATLQVPVLPQGLEPVGVGVTDDSYTYSVRAEGSDMGCGIKWMSKSLYEALYRKDYSDYFDKNDFYILSTETESYDGVSCEAVTYQTAATTLKDVRFIIEDETRKLSILLSFVLEDTSDYLPTSETVPYSVTVYCEQKDVYARVYLYNLEEAPLLDWLTSFGMTDFIPSADAAE